MYIIIIGRILKSGVFCCTKYGENRAVGSIAPQARQRENSYIDRENCSAHEIPKREAGLISKKQG